MWSRFTQLQRRDVRWRDGVSLLAGEPSAAGITVTVERALSVPAVYSCIAVLSQDIGRTPLKLRRRIGDDSYLDAVDHPLYELLHGSAEPGNERVHVQAGRTPSGAIC
jgi:phage portal protein BeeE